MHTSKDVPTGQHCGETSLTFPGKSARLGAFLKWLYTDARSKRNKQEESEICLQLQGYNLLGCCRPGGIAHTAVLQWVDTGSLGRTAWKVVAPGGGVACYVKEHWECVELYPRSMWSHWRIYGSGLLGRPMWVMLWCVCCRPCDQGADDAFFRQPEEASHSQALVLTGSLTTLISAGSATQRGTNNPGSFWRTLMITS